MNRFQPLNFQDVEEFLDYLPNDELLVVNRLREIIGEIFPRFREKLAYNVPFYYNAQRICFIWPASVPWGNLKDGVALGFPNGRILDPNKELLQFDGRKSLGRIILKSLDEIASKEVELRYALQEAYLLDQQKS